MSWTRMLAGACAPVVLIVLAATLPAGAAEDDGPIDVLVYSAVYGFRHESVATVEQRLLSLGDGAEFEVTATSDPARLSADTLADTDVVVFNNSSGNQPWSDQQRRQLLDWVGQGNGVVAIHAADDANYDWAPYGRLLGAVFSNHPHTGEAINQVEDPDHPIVGHLPESFPMEQEHRRYQHSPRDNVHMLTSLDQESLAPSGVVYGEAAYPQTWCQEVYGGRSFTTGWGHHPQTFERPELWHMLVQALRWAGGRISADCSPDEPVPDGRLEAEFTDLVGGGQVSAHTAEGGQAVVSHLVDGSYVRFSRVDLTGVEALAVNVSVETPADPRPFHPRVTAPALGGAIGVFVGHPFDDAGACPFAGQCTRAPDARIDVPAGPPGWNEFTVELEGVDGVHDLYLIIDEPLTDALMPARLFLPESTEQLHTMSIDWAEVR